MSLLEKAQKVTFQLKGRSISPDHCELAIAWLKGEVTTKQCEVALGKKGGIDSPMAHWIKEAYRRGDVKVK